MNIYKESLIKEVELRKKLYDESLLKLLNHIKEENTLLTMQESNEVEKIKVSDYNIF